MDSNPAPIAMLGFGVAAVGVVLYLMLWRAWLFVRPDSIRIELDEPPDKMQLPSELEKLAAELGALGFKSIGSHWEKPAFTKETVSYDYVNAEKKVFATLYEGRDGGGRLYLLTPIKCANGTTGFVVTANYRRPAREVGRCYFSGGLENYSADRVVKAHLRRLDTQKLEPTGDFTSEGRLTAGRQWFKGYGRTEIRAQNLHGVLWSASALAMLVVGFIKVFG